jgi:hypothetical protein
MHDQLFSCITSLNDYVAQHPDKTEEDIKGLKILTRAISDIVSTDEKEKIIVFWDDFKETKSVDEEYLEKFSNFSAKEKDIIQMLVEGSRIIIDYAYRDDEQEFIDNLNKNYETLLNYVKQKK